MTTEPCFETAEKKKWLAVIQYGELGVCFSQLLRTSSGKSGCLIILLIYSLSRPPNFRMNSSFEFLLIYTKEPSGYFNKIKDRIFNSEDSETLRSDDESHEEPDGESSASAISWDYLIISFLLLCNRLLPGLSNVT